MNYDYRFLIFRLKHIKGVGNKGRLKLLSYLLDHPFNDSLDKLVEVAHVSKKYEVLFKQTLLDAFSIRYSEYEEFLEHTGMITLLDDEYPKDLSTIYNPPIALFYKGNLSLLQMEKIAVIGSRDQSEFGKQMIDIIIPGLIQEKRLIVSGLARGNDTYSHKIAIRNHGSTIGVLGNGLDYTYPRENHRLQTYMEDHQLVISEYLPKTKPLPYHFPERNRIIAGLARGLVVIEAKKKSGTYITAELALEEGRDVFAVANNCFHPNSEGCLNLIQAGAKCVWKASDILAEYNI